MKIKRAPTEDDAKKRASTVKRHKHMAEKISSQMRVARAERVKSTEEVVITKENKEEGTE